MKPGGTLLTVTENGYGKRTEIDEYRLQSAAASASSTSKTTDRNGLVVGVVLRQDGDELLVITQQGMILRMLTDDVRSIGRATQGVTIIDLEEDDRSCPSRGWSRRKTKTAPTLEPPAEPPAARRASAGPGRR